jgi:ABC-2 type transport system permease protein
MRQRLRVIGAIIAKDVRVYARDRFYVVVTLLGLLAYIAVFWLLPATTDDVIGLGVHLPGGDALLESRTGDESSGFVIVPFDTAEELEAAVASADGVVAGMDFPEPFLEQAAAGEHTTARVLVGSGTPEQLRPLLISGVQEIVASIGQLAPAVTLPQMQEVLIGPDRAGQQLSLRERLRPLFVFLVLIVEMFALASLVASEIAQRTVTAVLVSPARVSDLLAAKAVLGAGLAFAQAAALVIATQSLPADPSVLLVALLLGALLVTGFGLIAGSTGRDFVGIVFWSMFFVVPLSIPAVATLFPGGAAGWVAGLPTYGLVQAIVGTTAYGESWSQLWPHLAWLSGWCTVTFALGVLVLARRAERV